MKRRLTPDPLQVDPWTNPVRISFPTSDFLFYLSFVVERFETESVTASDIKGSASCPPSEGQTTLPCGDDAISGSTTEMSLRHLADIRTFNFDGGLLIQAEMGFLDLNTGEMEIDELGISFAQDPDSFPSRFEVSWSRIFEETDRASVDNDPTAYGLGADVATFGVGEWSLLPFRVTEPEVDSSMAVTGEIIGQVGDLTLRQPSKVEKRWGFDNKICGELFCAAQFGDFPRWLWPVETGPFQQEPLSPPKLNGMRLTIDGVSYALVAMALDPRDSDNEKYFAFFQREDATRTLSEILS